MRYLILFLLVLGCARAEEVDRGALAARRSKQHDAAAKFHKALREGKDADARKWGLIAAEAGNVEVMWEVAQLYDAGMRGFEEDDDQARRWYELALAAAPNAKWAPKIKAALAKLDEDGEEEQPKPAAPPAPAVASAPPPEPKKREFANATRWGKKEDYEGKKVLWLTIYGWDEKTDVYEVRRRDFAVNVGWTWSMQKMTAAELKKGWKQQNFEPAWCTACKSTGIEKRRGEDRTTYSINYHPGGAGSNLSAGMYGSRSTEATYTNYSCSKCGGSGWFKPSFGYLNL